MRKKLLLLWLMCFASASLMAQESTRWSDGIGIRFGAGMSWIRGDGMFNNIKSGYTAGVNYRLKLARNLTLTPGLYFTTKGGSDRRVDQQQGEDISAKLKLSYIQIPVMVGYDFNFGSFRLAPSIGGYYAYATSGRVSASDGSSGSWLDSNNPRQKILRHSDAGLRFNCDFVYRRFVIGVAYDLGLANITAKYRQYGSSASIPLNYEWRTNALFLTVGWNF